MCRQCPSYIYMFCGARDCALKLLEADNLHSETNKQVNETFTNISPIHQRNKPTCCEQQTVRCEEQTCCEQQTIRCEEQTKHRNIHKHIVTKTFCRGCRSLAGSRRLGCYRFGGGAESAKFAYDCCAFIILWAITISWGDCKVSSRFIPIRLPVTSISFGPKHVK